MTNHRLRGAMLNADVSAQRLAELVGVDIKTVGRWIAEDRLPYPVTRHRVARALDQLESFLWPSTVVPELPETDLPSLSEVWPTRTSISSDIWHSLFSRATKQLDVLVYAGTFLMDTLDLVDVLRWKAGAGTSVRILVGDAGSAAVRARADELGLPWLPARCRTTATYVAASTASGICVRQHATTLYASHFRFDDTLLVNLHSYGVWASQSPVVRSCRDADPMFSFYSDAFDRVWRAATPISNRT